MKLSGFILYCIFSYFTSNFINSVQPSPFIDETFHMKQAQLYCGGNFTVWDNKITTLPGLYIFTTGFNGILSFFFLPTICTTDGFRRLNTIVSIALYYVFFSIMTMIQRNTLFKTTMPEWEAFNLSIFPVSFFFNFLYYTDTLSTFMVLLMFSLYKTENHLIASFIGFISVAVRQTNVAWVGFLLLEYLLKIYKEIFPHNFDIFSTPPFVWADTCWNFLTISVVSSFMGYFSVCLLFLLFVFLNDGSLVVGDQLAHQPTIHICQIFYFTLFFIIFAFPFLFNAIKPFVRFCVLRFHTVMVTAAVMIVIVHYNTMVHPYLLADNRHYTFYFWKDILHSDKYKRYTLIPLYIFGLFAIKFAFKKSTLVVSYFITISLLLVPQKLLEFRYYILPYYFLRMHIRPDNNLQLALETMLYLAVNFVTLYIFHKKQFFWTDSDEVQRIIW